MLLFRFFDRFWQEALGGFPIRPNTFDQVVVLDAIWPGDMNKLEEFRLNMFLAEIHLGFTAGSADKSILYGDS